MRFRHQPLHIGTTPSLTEALDERRGLGPLSQRTAHERLSTLARFARTRRRTELHADPWREPPRAPVVRSDAIRGGVLARVEVKPRSRGTSPLWIIIESFTVPPLGSGGSGRRTLTQPDGPGPAAIGADGPARPPERSRCSATIGPQRRPNRRFVRFRHRPGCGDPVGRFGFAAARPPKRPWSDPMVPGVPNHLYA